MVSPMPVEPMVAWASARPAPRWEHLAGEIFKSLLPDDGLPHQLVNAIAEDKAGFVWFGTADGLARWDGYRFRIYRAIKDDPAALADSNIIALFAGKDGRLWVGTATRGLAWYDPDCDCFHPVAVAPGMDSSIRIWDVASDGGSGLWVGSNVGLLHYDEQDGSLRPQDGLADKVSSQPNNWVRAVLVDRKKRLWVGNDAGLLRRDTANDAWTQIPMPTDGAPARVIRLFEDSAGNIWIGTSNQGAFLFIKNEGKAVRLAFDNDKENASESLRAESFVEAEPGEVWVGLQGQGILAIDLASGRTHPIRHDASRSSSLLQDHVTSMLHGRGSTLWIGTQLGVSRFEAGQAGIRSVFGASAPELGAAISNSDVTAVYEDRLGRLWLGMANNGIDIIDPAGGATKHISAGRHDDPASLPNSFVSAIASMDDGGIWVGTDAGLYRIDPETLQVARRLVDPQRPDLGIYSLLADGGVLWIGGSGSGLWRMDMRTGRVTARYGPDELTDLQVQVLAKQGDTALWIGTANGLNRLSTESGQIERISSRSEQPDGLVNGSVATILVDESDQVWFGTQGGGISLLLPDSKPGDRHFRTIRQSDGLPNGTIDMLVRDHQGIIWISTDGGLARLDPQSREIRSLGRADGVAFRGYWGNAGILSREGEVLFGGSGGLTVIEPNRLTKRQFTPPLVITELKVGGRQVPWKPDQAAVAVVSPDGNSLSAEFAALDYSAPELSRYSYRLEGYDEGWIDTDAGHRVAKYTNLPPGRYRLTIRGSNRDGVWSETMLQLPIAVLPAWYQTWSFKIACLFLVTSSAAVVFRTRTRRLRARQRELESQIAERTQQLAEAVQRADSLLANILPADVVRQLASTGHVIPTRHESVTILFTDLAGFTQASATMPADRMVAELNDIFAAFDDISAEEELEKIKTIGDAYMAVCGLSERQSDHARRCVRAALRMQAFIAQRNATHSFKWRLRVGIHSGPVVSGVVGKRKYAYDIWGDTVNIAARMESTGEPDQVNISAYTHDLVSNYFACDYRGKVAVKGKGEVDMYFVLREL